MAASSTAVVFRAFVLMMILDFSVAIRCYYCNSANNSACVDPELFRDTAYDPLRTLDHNLVPLVECESSVPTRGSPVKFFCRKIVQSILNAHGHESELRVTRSCGWVPHHRDCYNADNNDHTERVCQCFSDGCNSTTHLRAATILVTFTTIVAAWIFSSM